MCFRIQKKSVERRLQRYVSNFSGKRKKRKRALPPHSGKYIRLP